MELVVWGTPDSLGSTYGIRWTAAIRGYWDITNVPPYYLGIIVGLVLSDGSLELVKGGVNARLRFKQSIIHLPYFWSILLKMSHFCFKGILQDHAQRKGVRYFAVLFVTRAASHSPFSLSYITYFITRVSKLYLQIFIIY